MVKGTGGEGRREEDSLDAGDVRVASCPGNDADISEGFGFWRMKRQHRMPGCAYGSD